jgi:glycosyltransferase involved in cell wall biosynthesis
MKACFFARVRDPKLFDIVEFYRNDIRALRDHGFDVVTARSFGEIPPRADLYFTWWWGPGAIALAKSVPSGRPNIFTGTLQLDPTIGWWRELGLPRQLVVRACLRLASANLATCDVELGYLRQLGAPRAERVYPGLDFAQYRPGSSPHATREKLVLSVSHLTAENVGRKRLTTVIRAVPAVLARHPDARFVMVGQHDTGYATLAALAKELGVSHAVRFPGRVSLEEKLALYQDARVFAQPTIYEGFGVAHAEAMAAGLPVITSPRGAIPEVVGDCGRYVEPDDASGMAGQICALLGDPDTAQSLGRAARERVLSRFSYERRRDALGTVIARVLGR